MSDRFSSEIVLHVKAHTMKECLEVVKSLTISLRINSSVLINMLCVLCKLDNILTLLKICAKTHAICSNQEI